MASISNEQNFVVRIPPKDQRKRFHIMKFRSGANTDPAKWTQVRMVRENNKKEYKTNDEEAPKFGAGSEYGREEREEARRKKYGYASRKYDPDMQPWLMRIGGKKDGKHFRGQREGGVSDNTSYYVFTHAPDGSFEACPVKEWYNFVPRVAYRTLDCDEAEEKFAQRGKILNLWAGMIQKKLKPEGGIDAEDGAMGDDEDGSKKGKKGGKNKSAKELKISDMDDEMGSGNELDSSSDEDADQASKKKKSAGSDDEDAGKKGKGKGKCKKKKNKGDVDDEAFEDSDDGENEGMEVDYMSDESSEDDEDVKYDIQGVDQDEGLAKMLDSDEDEEDEEDKEDKDEDDEEKKEKPEGGKKSAKSSANNSRSGSPAPTSEKTDEKSNKAEKRKAMVDKLVNGEPSTKKGRFESSSSLTPAVSSGIEATFEEDVRRYLARKPMTTTEILRKMATKKTGISKEELMPLLVNVLKRINPTKQKIKGNLYLSLKAVK